MGVTLKRQQQMHIVWAIGPALYSCLLRVRIRRPERLVCLLNVEQLNGRPSLDIWKALPLAHV